MGTSVKWKGRPLAEEEVMKARRLMMLLLMFCCLPVAALALEVSEAVITTEVRDRAPVDAIQTYPATVGRLFCFTRVTGAAAETSITHVWYRDGVEMTRIELPVRSGDWRTWSSKTIFPGAAGDWRVDVLAAEGELLKTIAFTLN
jgi:hypothetical protein